jgi:histidinol-phosphate phosphatase family protein
MEAVVLCGGRGLRLAGVAGDLPKFLVAVAGVPVAKRQLDELVLAGVSRVWLMEGHRGELIREALGDDYRGMPLEHVQEAAPMGTAGCLAVLRGRIEADFLVMYGDVISGVDLRRLAVAHRRFGGAATLVVHPNDHPADSDLVEVDAQDRVVALHPKRRSRPDDLRNLASAAMHVLSPRALLALPTSRPQGLLEDLVPALLERGERVHAYRTPEYLKDMGTPARLRQVDADVRSGRVDRCRWGQRRPMLLLDRDGVLNVELNGVLEPGALRLIPGAGEAVARLNRAGWLVVVVTNQPAIAKGQMSERAHEAVRRRLESLLAVSGAWVDDYLFCPHHPDGGFAGERSELKIDCLCRKPQPGMLGLALERWPADSSSTWMVGDSWRDMAAAHSAGVAAIGVKTGHGLREAAPVEMAHRCQPDLVLPSVVDVVEHVLGLAE